MGVRIYKPHRHGQGAVDFERCRSSVTDEGGWHWHQCSRKAKVTRMIDGVEYGFCKQHDPEEVQRRNEERLAAAHRASVALDERFRRRAAEKKFCAGITTSALERLGSLQEVLDQLAELRSADEQEVT